MTLHKGQWIDALNAQIIPFELRPDAARWKNDGIHYRIVEAFNFRDGRWDLENQGERGCIDPWASAEWHMGSTIEGSGGATHFFLVALDKDGKRIPDKGMWFFDQPMTPDFVPINTKNAKQDGTENIPLNGNSYVPERDEQGAWRGCLFGRSDVFQGAGLPANEHTSWVIVFQETVEETPDPDPEPEIGDYAALLERIAVASERTATAFETLIAKIWGTP